MRSSLFYLLLFLLFHLTSCEDKPVPVVKTPKIATTTVEDNYYNKYNAVKIGTLYWFKENLRGNIYSKYLKLPSGYEVSDTINPIRPYDVSIAYTMLVPVDTLAAQWPFNGKDTEIKKYGRMYTWYAASDERNVCPRGWHVPSETEWDNMIKLFGGDSLAGAKLKDTSNIEWNSPNVAEYNEYKFNAKATGYRTEFGSYINQGKFAFFWSSTADPDDVNNGIAYALYAQGSKVYKVKKSKRVGMAIRCVR